MKVVLIDDDPLIRDTVTMCFETGWPGSQVKVAQNGPEGLDLVKAESPDIVILDVWMPEMDGFEVLQGIRRFSDLPIIMLTVADRESDIVKGLELGAADYVLKPFKAIELLARTRAVLRRVQMWSLSEGRRPFISKDLSLDFDTREVTVAGEPVKLTPTEYKLLTYLVRNQGQFLSHSALLGEVWGKEYTESSDLLKVHIQHLRKKLKDNSQNPRMIITERGKGYKFIASN